MHQPDVDKGLGVQSRPATKKRYNAAVRRASQTLENQKVVYEYFQLQRDLLAAREQVRLIVNLYGGPCRLHPSTGLTRGVYGLTGAGGQHSAA